MASINMAYFAYDSSGELENGGQRKAMVSARDQDLKVDTIKQQILSASKVPENEKAEFRQLLEQLIAESKRGIAVSAKVHTNKKSNPAVIGLASFAITATLFQFYNFGWLSSNASVLFLGIILGGLVQLFAGLLEFVTGNNFGFAIFSTFGAFWVALVLIIIARDYTRYHASETDMGYFMLCFLIFTAILLAASLKHNTILPILILTLFFGIASLMIFHFDNNYRGFKIAGAVMLLINSILAYYFLAALLLEDTYKFRVLPIGPPISDLFSRRRRSGFESGHESA